MIARDSGRLAGLFWLLFVVSIAVALGWVRATVVAPGDPGQTAANLVAHEALWRWGIAATWVTYLALLAFAFAVFRSFNATSPMLAQIVLGSALVSVTIALANSVTLFAALAAVVSPLSEPLGTATAHFWLRIGNFGQAILEILWTPLFVALGLLFITTQRVPALFGWLLISMGVGYSVNALTKLLTPDFHPAIFTQAAMALGAIGGLPTIAWLIFKGFRDTDAAPR